jgi:hypothetical protein
MFQPNLRPQVTELVSSARQLYEETCNLLREKAQSLVSTSGATVHCFTQVHVLEHFAQIPLSCHISLLIYALYISEAKGDNCFIVLHDTMYLLPSCINYTNKYTACRKGPNNDIIV